MAYIKVNQENVKDKVKAVKVCPFNAIEEKNGLIEINSGCKMCKICVNQMPKIYSFVEGKQTKVNKEDWKGIAVYVDHVEGKIHPVTYELIGKARKLAKKINHPVYCLFSGSNIKDKAKELFHYGVDEVFVYDKKELFDFRIEPYTAVFENFINKVKPTIILVGGTTIGRSLAPRVAARFKTGLTADCTILDVKEDTDLDQIRPAFGGNIMAHIHTPNHRPQFATVRYKIFDAPEKSENVNGKITECKIDSNKLKSNIEVLEVKKKEKVKTIEEAEIIVVAGNGIKKKEDLEMIRKLADKLGGMIATTRPLIEAGWIDAKRQIGLSGRTVKPKLIITCGVSGSIQFVAGMNNSDNIFAINSDPNAQIFEVANYGIVGDLYEVVPELIERL